MTDEKEIKRKLDSFKHADWYGDQHEEGEFIKGLVMSVSPATETAKVRFGNYTANITAKEMGRSGKKPSAELKQGYLAEFEIKKVDNENKTVEVELTQIPQVQAAIISLDSHKGEIAAMVGGYDYHSSKFNNATQGLRQTGSCYKPFIYTAAVEWGMTPDMTVSGAPIKRGSWQPHNYDGSTSHGNVPMKIALAKSYNLAAVHLLEQVGVQTGAQMVRRFGITNPMAPSLPSALGASEASLIEMVSAYSTFPNKGVRVQPHLIRKVLDRDGKVLEEWNKTTFKVTSEYVALTMVEMMRGVTAGGGTAPGASAAGHPLAGKTGTVNDQTDVWFIGYTPTYVTGVWMGNPERKENLGSGMTGGRGAMPYFNEFMNAFMKEKPKEKFEDAPDIPSDIKSLIERRKREEIEKLEKAELEARKSGAIYTPSKRVPTNVDGSDLEPTDGTPRPTEQKQRTPRRIRKKKASPVTNPKPDNNPPKPNNPANPPPVKKPDTPAEKPDTEGTKRKGKKGDG